uniref:Glutathione S-transferase n=1 Tax=Amphiprion percula TaxID=161767 RepID=A0A3P8U2L0_AMPPE
MPMELAYWDIRGLAQPIRLLREYTGTEYGQAFSCGEAPDYDKSCWFGIKDKLGMDFPNLPYLVDGDRKVVQSNAIMRYIARNTTCGETEDEQVRVDIIENQAMDFRNGFVMLCYMNYITFVDFIIYELLDQHRMFDSKCLDAFDNLKKFLDRFEVITKFIKNPVNNKMAKWGNK